jgi:DNA-binding transcriptional MocR family regulator
MSRRSAVRAPVPRRLRIELALLADQPVTPQLVAHIESMIVRGVYRPGDTFPSAQEVAQHLGSTRAAVDAAFALLDRAVTSLGPDGVRSITHGAVDLRIEYARRVFADVIAIGRNLNPPLTQAELNAAMLHELDRHFRPRRKAIAPAEMPEPARR